MKLKERYIELNIVLENKVTREWNHRTQKINVFWQDMQIWILPKAEHLLDELTDEEYSDFIMSLFGLTEVLNSSARVSIHNGGISIDFVCTKPPNDSFKVMA